MRLLLLFLPPLLVLLQPVGFVTFQTRAGAEAAKQDLQVRFILHTRYLYYNYNNYYIILLAL